MDLAVRVGLQLLLDPGSSAPLFRAGCTTVGVIYPVYESFKVLDSSPSPSPSPRTSTGPSTSRTDKDRKDELLLYWAVYSCLNLVEHQSESLLRAIPYYYHVKFGFLLWLMLPQTQGAKLLYQRYVQPTLRKYRPKVDVVLHKSHDMAAAVYTIYKVPLDAAASAACMGLAQARSFLVWLADSESEPHQPKSKAADKKSGGAKGGGQFLVN